MNYKYSLFPLISAVPFLVFFILVASNFNYVCVQPLWGIILLFIVPSVVFTVIGILALKGKLKRKATIIITSILIVLFIILAVFLLYFLHISMFTTPATNPFYYHRAYEYEAADDERVKEYFPEYVPKNAKDVKFWFNYPFLQGGSLLELSFTADIGTINEWIAKLEKAAEWYGPYTEWDSIFYSSEKRNESDILYQLCKEDHGGGFNHGKICYVIVNISEGSMKFRYEHW